jgi:hypothetical protein
VSKGTILVVDPDDSRKSLDAYFTEQGYEVLSIITHRGSHEDKESLSKRRGDAN